MYYALFFTSADFVLIIVNTNTVTKVNNFRSSNMSHVHYRYESFRQSHDQFLRMRITSAEFRISDGSFIQYHFRESRL